MACIGRTHGLVHLIVIGPFGLVFIDDFLENFFTYLRENHFFNSILSLLFVISWFF